MLKTRVEFTGENLKIPVSEDMLGRILMVQVDQLIKGQKYLLKTIWISMDPQLIHTLVFILKK